MPKLVSVVLGTIATGILLYVLYLFQVVNIIYGFCVFPLLERDFDSEVWKSGSVSVRGFMVDDLMKEHHGLKGVAWADAMALLGPPDFEDSRLACYNVGPLDGAVGPFAFDYRLCLGGWDGVVQSVQLDD